MSGTVAAPEGITDPPIDDLLERADSKYALVLYSAKRARQINAYYSQLNEGLLEYVGPLVETRAAGEAALDRDARDRRRAADVRGHRGLTLPSMRIVLGVAGGIAAYKAALLLRLLREEGHDVRVVPTRGGARVRRARRRGRRCPGEPVTTEVFDDVDQVRARRARPAGRSRDRRPGDSRPAGPRGAGLADDLLTATLLPARCPVLLAPGDAHRDVGPPGDALRTWRPCGSAACT